MKPENAPFTLGAFSNIPALTLFRGFAAPDPFMSRITLPAFTDVREVAQAYAQSYGGSVHAFQLAIKKPLVLGDLQEDVVTVAQIRDRLTRSGAISTVEVDQWIDTFSAWRFSGEWIDITCPPEASFDGDPFCRDETYADTYRVADDPRFVELAKAAGFDGFLYRGTFTTELVAAGSYNADTLSVIEVRPFFARQILQIVGLQAA